MESLSIKRNDQVTITAGQHAGQIGTVITLPIPNQKYEPLYTVLLPNAQGVTVGLKHLQVIEK